jgi:hypothetical protein
LLQHLARRLPEAAWVLRQGGVLRGYLLGRDGRTALQLGPLVVDSGNGGTTESGAIALLEAAAGALDRRAMGQHLVTDVRDGQAALQDRLADLGFTPERPFTRMVRPLPRTEVAHLHESAAAATGAGVDVQAPGDPSLIALVAGPELG